MPGLGVNNDDFRVAQNDEIVPHQARCDQERLPHPYYITYFVNYGQRTVASWRFVFAAKTIETPRDIRLLQGWIEQYAGTSNVVVLAFHLVREEVL